MPLRVVLFDFVVPTARSSPGVYSVLFFLFFIVRPCNQPALSCPCTPLLLFALSLVLSVSRALLSLSLFSVLRRIGYVATSLMDPRALIIVMALACSDPRVVPTIRDCLPSSCLLSRGSFSSSFLLETARAAPHKSPFPSPPRFLDFRGFMGYN